MTRIISLTDLQEQTLQKLALSLGTSEEALLSEAIKRYLTIQEFYELRRKMIGNMPIDELPTDEEIFDLVS